MNLSSVVKQIPEGGIFITYNKEQQEHFREALAHKFISSLKDIQKTESKLKGLDKRINIIPENEVVKIFIYGIINGRFFARNAKIINTINSIRKEYEKWNISTNMFTDKDFFPSSRNEKIKNQLLKIFNIIPKVNQIFSEEEKISS